MIAELFLKYWKQIVIGLLIIGFIVYWNSLINDRNELLLTNQKIDQMQASIKGYQKDLDQLRDMGIAQQKRLDDSIKNSNDIAKKFDTQLKAIAMQKPPKECNAAVKWFIETKGDLAWPK